MFFKIFRLVSVLYISLKKNFILLLKWQNLSVNRQIFSAALIVATMTFAVKLISAAKEIAVAYFFGTDSALDAFLIAFIIPSFAINVLAGSLITSLMPVYCQVKEKNSGAAIMLYSSSMALCLIFLLGAASFMASFATYILPVLGSGFDEQTLTLCRHLFYLLLVGVIFKGATMMYSTVLNAEKKFAMVGIAPACISLCTILFLVFFHKNLGIYSLALGVLFGMFLEAVMLAFWVSRSGLPVLPHWYGMNKHLKAVTGQYLPMVAGAFLMSSTNLIDNSMAAMLAPGSVASLNYGNKAIALFLGLGSAALATAVLPYFSDMAAKNNLASLQHTWKKYSKLIFLVTLPLVVLIIFFSKEITALFFQRGAFTYEDTHIVAEIQSFYALQIPFYIIGIVQARLLSALKLNKILMWVSGFNLGINILGNLVLMHYLGLAGIALSTSVVYFLSTAIIFFTLQKRLTVLQKNWMVR